MHGALRRARLGLDLAAAYIASGRSSPDDASLFGTVERYLMFVGTPRSGHSLVGALLDAHPEAVIAHELDALLYVHARFNRDRLFRLLLDNARASAVGGRRSGPYAYAVAGQWQGRFRRIRVIGDKQGEGSALRLRRWPWLMARLRCTVGVPVRVVHVVRNPFDNIATMARHAARHGVVDVRRAVRRYFDLCETVTGLEEGISRDEFLRLRHEEFVRDPSVALERLVRWTGLEPETEYLKAGAAIVRETPRETRHDVEWPSTVRAEVEARIRGVPFLDGYAFDA